MPSHKPAPQKIPDNLVITQTSISSYVENDVLEVISQIITALGIARMEFTATSFVGGPRSGRSPEGELRHRMKFHEYKAYLLIGRFEGMLRAKGVSGKEIYDLYMKIYPNEQAKVQKPAPAAPEPAKGLPSPPPGLLDNNETRTDLLCHLWELREPASDSITWETLREWASKTYDVRAATAGMWLKGMQTRGYLLELDKIAGVMHYGFTEKAADLIKQGACPPCQTTPIPVHVHTLDDVLRSAGTPGSLVGTVGLIPPPPIDDYWWLSTRQGVIQATKAEVQAYCDTHNYDPHVIHCEDKNQEWTPASKRGFTAVVSMPPPPPLPTLSQVAASTQTTKQDPMQKMLAVLKEYPSLRSRVQEIWEQMQVLKNEEQEITDRLHIIEPAYLEMEKLVRQTGL